MVHFPATDPEFEEMFKTGEDCMEYIISVRWPEGSICPICQHDKLWRNEKAHILECSACGHRMRPLVGTIFQDTHLPLKDWFKMMGSSCPKNTVQTLQVSLESLSRGKLFRRLMEQAVNTPPVTRKELHAQMQPEADSVNKLEKNNVPLEK